MGRVNKQRIREWMAGMDGLKLRPLRPGADLAPLQEAVGLIGTRMPLLGDKITTPVRETLDRIGEVIAWRGDDLIHPECLLTVRDNGVLTWFVWRNATAPPPITSPKFIVVNAEPVYGGGDEPVNVFIMDEATRVESVPFGRRDRPVEDHLRGLNRRYATSRVAAADTTGKRKAKTDARGHGKPVPIRFTGP